MDYAIWGILEARVNAKAHRSVDSVKRAVKLEWAKAKLSLQCDAPDSCHVEIHCVADCRHCWTQMEADFNKNLQTSSRDIDALVLLK